MFYINGGSKLMGLYKMALGWHGGTRRIIDLKV